MEYSVVGNKVNKKKTNCTPLEKSGQYYNPYIVSTHLQRNACLHTCVRWVKRLICG